MTFKFKVHDRISRFRRTCAASALALSCSPALVHAADLQWAGRTWNVTSGGMAGVAAGSPSNVSVDSSGYLHLKITNTGGTWTASEVFTTDTLGFGTYQWQVDGAIDGFDKNVVLGLYPYGPAAGIGQDGTNEIDIEYSFWGNAGGVNGDWTDYPNTGTTIGEKSYTFSLSGGTYSTSRFIWSSASIQDFLIAGFQPVGSTTGLLDSWTYAPTDPSTNIPQQAMPLGINLWCFDAPPSDGKDVEVVIRDFQFVPEQSGDVGAGGAGGMASSAGASGSADNASTGAGGASPGGSSSNASDAGSSSGGSGMAGGVAGAATSGVAGAATSGGASGIAGVSGAATGNTAGASGSASARTAGSNGATTTDSSDSGGCSLSSERARKRSALLFALPFALLALGRRRRRSRAHQR